CEDFGQIACYKGAIPLEPHKFVLDDHHTFYTNKPIAVCGNTASMLMNTRFGKHFKIIGDKSCHFGPIAKDVLSSGSCC
ncbi:MAG: methyltransferase type 11, partial [Patescibacteria group bacterium]